MTKKELCEKYPFLKWYGDPLYMGYTEENGPSETYTWQDEIPEGWQKAFCPQIWDELKEILERHNYLNEFRFVQIKEKYGELCLYSGLFDEITKWEIKYGKLSEKICIHCGKPAKYMSLGWISPWCEDCAKENNNYYFVDIDDLDDYYLAPRDQRDQFIKTFGEDKDSD